MKVKARSGHPIQGKRGRSRVKIDFDQSLWLERKEASSQVKERLERKEASSQVKGRY